MHSLWWFELWKRARSRAFLGLWLCLGGVTALPMACRHKADPEAIAALWEAQKAERSDEIRALRSNLQSAQTSLADSKQHLEASATSARERVDAILKSSGQSLNDIEHFLDRADRGFKSEHQRDAERAHQAASANNDRVRQDLKIVREEVASATHELSVLARANLHSE